MLGPPHLNACDGDTPYFMFPIWIFVFQQFAAMKDAPVSARKFLNDWTKKAAYSNAKDRINVLTKPLV
ncbi:hypothetical protein CEXT_23001 [Caerostris extrusa]|uniref:Uncharacterized protein n=1 Tax=Caerostris extrusa TaxID=172846 RepID=A0AAV4UMF2_CAEEX|nr:hypothetical protein CEXT_23001 [Caerostris extrusa]